MKCWPCFETTVGLHLVAVLCYEQDFAKPRTWMNSFTYQNYPMKSILLELTLTMGKMKAERFNDVQKSHGRAGKPGGPHLSHRTSPVRGPAP